MTPPNKQARQLRDAVRYTVVAHGALREAERPCGAKLTTTHAYALLELLDRAEAMTVSELANRLSVDRTNVSRLCVRMEEAGELRRGADPRDGRATRLRLTARGKKLAQAVDESSARHFGRLAAQLGDDAGTVIKTMQRLHQLMIAGQRETPEDEE